MQLENEGRLVLFCVVIVKRVKWSKVFPFLLWCLCRRAMGFLVVCRATLGAVQILVQILAAFLFFPLA